ncbi:MAG: ATP-binding cassette domain-containing protein [Acidobacteria bacterium]|nr:ATP-binding cassette domain-containing protein [Acidobacteriota bacterium]
MTSSPVPVRPAPAGSAPATLAIDYALLRRLAKVLEPYRRWILGALAMAGAHALLGAAVPFLTKLVVDVFVGAEGAPPGPPAWLPADPRQSVALIAGVYLALLAVQYLLRAGQIQWMSLAGQRAMHSLRERLFAKLQARPAAWFDRAPVGRLVAAVGADVESLNDLFTSGFVAVTADLLLLLFCFVWMFWFSPALAAVVLALTPLGVVLLWAFRRRSRPAETEVRGAVGSLQGFLAEQIAGMATVQLYSSEQDALSRFRELNAEHRKAQQVALTAQAWFLPAVELLAAVAAALLLVVAGGLIERQAVSLSVVVAFVQYGAIVFRPLQRMMERLSSLQAAFAAAERIFSLLDEPVEESAEPARPAPAPVASRPSKKGNKSEALGVEFDGVWFAYHGEDWVLRDVSLRVDPGEMVAVVGHTGAGKTTLIHLLLRFYEPQRGRILVGGRDLREWPREELRRQFGSVLQDPRLFGGSIESNIRLDPDAVDREQALEAARRVRLDEFVKKLPQGYETPVGERGASLSAGQRQLIGFARALAFRPQFLLLDEATSAVDPETEARIREGLAKLVEGSTSLVIAHRLSTVRRADRILVLHHGRVRETGRHQELLDARGLYWKLYQLQFQDQEAA